MYWRISHFPELDCLDPAARAAVLRTVTVWTWLGLVGRAWVVGWLVALPVIAVMAGLVPRGSRDVWLLSGGLSVTLVAGAAVYQLMLLRLRYTLRRELAAGFKGEPAPFCFRCGYDLRGRDGAVDPHALCPECGTRDHPATRPGSLSREAGRFIGAILKSIRS